MRDAERIIGEAVMAVALGHDDAAEKMERAHIHAEVCRRIFCDCGRVMDSDRAVMRGNRVYCGKSCDVLVGRPARGWTRLQRDGFILEARRHDDGRADYRVMRTKGRGAQIILSLTTTTKQAVAQGYSSWELRQGDKVLGQWHTRLLQYGKGAKRPPASKVLVDQAALEQALLQHSGVQQG